MENFYSKIDMQDSNKRNNRTVKYYSAFDEADNLVRIDDVTKENCKQHTYRCPKCKDPMTPALGDKIKHHFRHKGDHCSFESYLHKVAKLRFKEEFEHRDEFLIRADVVNGCDRFDECLLRKNQLIGGCKNIYQKVLNLKDYYDVCELEKKYEDFTADVLLSDSQGKYTPMFLEIYVSHPCEEGKIQSGVPIIEFKIKDEEELNALLKQRVFEEQRNVPVPNKKRKTEDKVLFYNFPNQFKDPKPFENTHNSVLHPQTNFKLKNVDVFIVKDNKCIINRESITCHDLYTGEHAYPNVCAWFTIINPHINKEIDRRYAERCMLALKRKINLCCEQCKFGERKVFGKNIPLYGRNEYEHLNCNKHIHVKYKARNYWGQIVDCDDSLSEYQRSHGGYNAIMNCKCNIFEFDEERLKNVVEQYGCIGWVKD